MIKDWPISARTKNALIADFYYSIEDLQNLTLDELKKIPKLGDKGVAEIREWCRTKYGVVFKSAPKEKRKFLKNAKDAKQVVEHFLKEPKDWGKQLRIADQLLQKYSLELLLRVPPDDKIYSLAWYNSDYGDKKIRQYMNRVIEQVEEEKPEITFEEESVFDLEVKKAPSLKGFMKLK